MRWTALLLMILAMATVAGCDDSDELTAAELAAARDVRWWVLEIPPGHEDDLLGLQTVTKDGTDKGGGGTGWSAGEVKVFLWDTGEDRLRYAFVGETSSGRGNMPNPFPSESTIASFVPSGEHVELGDLIYAAGKRTASVRRPPEGDEVAITFGFHEKE